MTRTQGQRRPAEPQDAAAHALTLRLDKPLTNRLNLASLATDQAASDIIRAALRSWLDRLEAAPEHRQAYDDLRAALAAATEPKQED
jgi:predicted transcriptional regulator